MHAGDVGDYSVLGTLGSIAPVTAVRGNVDKYGRAADLPLEVRLNIGGVSVYMIHIGAKPYIWLPGLPKPKPQVAICGHSHVPLLETASDVLFLNPGAAGTKPRFGRPLTAALLRITEGQPEAEIIEL